MMQTRVPGPEEVLLLVTTCHIDKRKRTTDDIRRASHLAAGRVANVHTSSAPISMGVLQGQSL